MLPWDLEDWLTEEGDRIVQKEAADGEAALSPRERLVLEVWLLDTQQRNGGLGQYFFNEGVERWQALCAAARAWPLRSFEGFAARVDEVIAGAAEPEEPLGDSEAELDGAYDACKAEVVAELRRLAGGLTPGPGAPQ